MNKNLLIFLVLILILAVCLWMFVWPEWRSFSSKMAEVKLAENNLAETKNLKNKFSDLAAIYQNKEKTDELAKIFDALPQKEDIPGLLVNLEALASKSGLIIKSVDFVEEQKSAASGSGVSETSQDQTAANPLSVNGLDVTLVLSGDYSGFLNFLRSQESNLRLMDVESLSFQRANNALGEASTESSDFSVNLKVYYR